MNDNGVTLTTLSATEGARAASEGLLLGLDLGTTTTRALLFDLSGRPIAEAYRELRIVHPKPGWAEYDPAVCWQATIEVIGQVLRQRDVSPGDVRAVGLTGLLHALVPVDAAGNPLARAMLWMDHRCAQQAAWLASEWGDLVQCATGHRIVTTTCSAPKLRWLVEHDPELIAQTAKFLPVKDFVRLKLTGEIATDPSDAAGTMLLDTRTGDWCASLLAAIGVPVEKLPPIRGSAEVAGGVTPGAAAMTGLLPGTPVVLGGGDTTTTRIGANAAGTGRACLYLGTAAWVAAPQRLAGKLVATATTGAALRWLVELLGGSQPDAPSVAYRALMAQATAAPPGGGGLIFLPHLMGERGPVYNPDAKGVLFGLTLAHGRAEVARAVLEGCAFHIRSILDQLTGEPLEELTLVGGGAKSPLWCQIFADVTGADVLVPAVAEAGALGAAILAGVGIGVYASVAKAAAELVRIAARHRPDAAKRRLYDEIYEVYTSLESRMTEMYDRVPVALEPA